MYRSFISHNERNLDAICVHVTLLIPCLMSVFFHFQKQVSDSNVMQ